MENSNMSNTQGIRLHQRSSDALKRAVAQHGNRLAEQPWDWYSQPLTTDELLKLTTENARMVLPIPFGNSTERLQQLEQHAQRNNARIIGFAPLRTSPVLQWLHGALAQGQFGRICMVEWNLFLNAKTAGEHPLSNLLFPYLDLQQWLFGPVSGLNATFAGHHKQSGAEQAGLINYKIDTEGIGLIAYTTRLWQQSMETSLVVLGEHASIKLGGPNLDQLLYCQGVEIPDAALQPASPEACTINWLAGNLPTAFGIQDALHTHELIERIYALRNTRHVRKTA